jgi:IS30 family transposase
MVAHLVDLPTSTITMDHGTMLVMFTAIAAWLWRIHHPYPQEPLQKG